MDEINIEILKTESVKENTAVVSLPVNFISVGNIEHDSVQIYIKQDVYRGIEKLAKENISKEVGSILIGDYVDEGNRKTVIISDYIEAKFTDSSAATLTFTHETWDYVYKEKDKKYVGKKIVGWQHTHPGYGIFLSNYDIFIQDNFFNLPWQIAYVVDPIADTRGFFEWKNNKVSKMTGFYVYDEIGKAIKIQKETKPSKKHFSILSLMLSFMLVISILISVSLAIERNNLTNRLNEALTQMKQADNMKTFSEPTPTPTPTSPNKEVASGDNIESFIVYEVQTGDYLEIICKKHRLDYEENIEKIMRLNNITNADKIYAGQKLYLPINK